MTRLLCLKTLHPLSEYTTLKIGGLARYFVEVESLSDYLEVLELSKSKSLPIFILGKGSNTLFIDEIFEAIVVLNKIKHIHIDSPFVTCGSGYHISLLSTKMSKLGLSGLEGASGIPATVGGAIYMNAGAGSWDTFQSLKSVTSVSSQGQVIVRDKLDLDFSYRHSLFQSLNEFIIEATFCLTPDDTSWNKQQKIILKRIATQPYKDPSAGCFFKNPPGHSAGALIDKTGLKGLEIDGAKVSTLHANFLINHGAKDAKRLLQLASLVQQKVYESTGIHLEQEVKLVGNFLYE